MRRFQHKPLELYDELLAVFREHLPRVHESRRKFMAYYIPALLVAQTVDSRRLATVFANRVKVDTNMARIQRFYNSDYAFDYRSFAQMVFRFLPQQKGLVLALDRTNWQYGSHDINILSLSVCHKGVAIPILHRVLTHPGNSNCQIRIELLSEFIELFGSQCISCLVADREFIGRDWFSWLYDQPFNFYIRVKKNLIIDHVQHSSGVKAVPAQALLEEQQDDTYVNTEQKFLIGDTFLYLSAKRIDNQDKLILASKREPDKAFETYRQRWQIESCFKALKTRGFHLEETHMTKADKIHKLITLLSFALLWAVKMGDDETEEKKALPAKIQSPRSTPVSLEGLTA